MLKYIPYTKRFWKNWEDARIKTVEDKVDRLCVMMEKYFEKQQPTK